MSLENISKSYAVSNRLKIPTKYLLSVQSREDGEMESIITIFDVLFYYIKKQLDESKTLSLLDVEDDVQNYVEQMFTLNKDLPLAVYHSLLMNNYIGQKITEEEFLKITNEFLTYHRSPKYKLYEDLKEAYKIDWVNRLANEFKISERNQLLYERETAKLLAMTDMVDRSPFEEDTFTFLYTMPSDPYVDELLDAFQSSFTSYSVPYIQYNSAKDKSEKISKIYKIYKGDSMENPPNYVTAVLDRTREDNTLYLNLWTGDNEEDAKNAKKDEYTTVTFHKTQSSIELTFISPKREGIKNLLLNRIFDHVPFFPKPSFEKVKITKISGTVLFYNIKLVPDVILNIVSNDPTFSMFLYPEESSHTFIKRERLEIGYHDFRYSGKEKNRNPIICSLTQGTIKAGDSFSLENGTISKDQKNDISYVSVRIIKGAPYNIIETFISILRKLLHPRLPAFTKSWNEFSEVLKNLYPPADYPALVRNQIENDLLATDRLIEIGSVKVPETTSLVNGKRVVDPEKVAKLEKDFLHNLMKYAHNFFHRGLARICQANYQPLMINDYEVEAWENTIFQVKGDKTYREEKKTVIRVPEDSPKQFFVSPYNDKPYIVWKKNKTKAEGEEEKEGKEEEEEDYDDDEQPNFAYEGYYPCCQASMKKKKGEGKSTKCNKLRSRKLLEEGRDGELPQNIKQFLGDRSVRVGVKEGSNSFLHCVFTALGDETYLSSSNKEEYVRQFRRDIPNKVNLDVLKQEFYGTDNRYIEKSILNMKTFFDPLYYYRVIEELFNVNVYVFSYDEKDQEMAEKMKDFTANQKSLLKIPRHSQFYCRREYDRKALVISRRLVQYQQMPRCELIRDETSKSNLYPSEIDERLSKALSYISREITWSINSLKSVITKTDVYNIDYSQMFPKIISQKVDIYGKCRLIEFFHKGVSYYIETSPCQPFNCQETKKMKLPTYDQVISMGKEILGSNPSAVSLDEEGLVNCVWYTIYDILSGVGIYCKEFKNVDNINLSVKNAVYYESEKKAQPPSAEIKRRADLFIQTLKYLYAVHLKEQKTGDFITFNYNYITETKEDIQYDMINVPRILPIGTVRQILQALERRGVPFIQNGKILLINSATEGVRYSLQKFHKVLEGSYIEPMIYRQLDRYYSSAREYTQHPMTEYVLDGESEFSFWASMKIPSTSIRQRNIQNLNLMIQTDVKEHSFTFHEPYVYEEIDSLIGGSYIIPNNNYYIIQNVVGGDILRALNVAYTWESERVNLGAKAPPLDVKRSEGKVLLPKFDRVKISPIGTLIFPESNGLWILEYNNSSKIYAAILPLYVSNSPIENLMNYLQEESQKENPAFEGIRDVLIPFLQEASYSDYKRMVSFLHDEKHSKQFQDAALDMIPQYMDAYIGRYAIPETFSRILDDADKGILPGEITEVPLDEISDSYQMIAKSVILKKRKDLFKYFSTRSRAPYLLAEVTEEFANDPIIRALPK